ncbi:response regulator [Tardiphaga sp. vice304]|uniref:response regulator n=1 Tax=unclassified Tardiphaga TaxID=2631404 RepID=UPI001165394E|nr:MULTISPECIES: response regulator [unclassified Tardiphaga]MBC7583595.1 response regulator [Tardiphaga sp.]QDM15083.1 response regulator [Tardiphaga sp. vice278]QDM20195.1 response regulator [Tardiphaga sp. vice154]QDM25273.1 response regulator [Tardiphaga sp. vice304]
MSIPKPTILVLDDDVPVLSSLQFLLETHDFAVRTFRSGASMLDWATLHPSDCIVIDYKMPELDGLQVAAQLRARGVATPVILVTGFPDDSIYIKAAAAGIQQVLLKPDLEDSLISRITSMLPAANAGADAHTKDIRKPT